MKDRYPHLFSPITVKGRVFRNRAFVAPTCQHALVYADPFPNDEFIHHYVNKAKYASAVSIASVHADTKMPIRRGYTPWTFEVLEDKVNRRPFQRMAEEIHYYGAFAAIETGFSGHSILTPADVANGYIPYGPSAYVRQDGVHVLEMPESEIERIVDAYGRFARAAKDSQFDILLIHNAHGAPLEQFLSPISNHRTDKFGGSLENRARFTNMILDRIRAEVGDDMLIEFRISGSQFVDGGMDIDECIAFLKMFEDRIDFAHVSAGTALSDSTRAIMHPTSFLPPATNNFLAEKVKQSGIKIPVISVGAIYEPALADRLIGEGKCDIVTSARAYIADPEFLDKAHEGAEDRIVPCVKCLRCLDGWKKDQQHTCTVNPFFGRETTMPKLFRPVKSAKKVCIVGGGPAGMKAAITAAERGHSVTLFEQHASLGGQLFFTETVPFKYDLNNYKKYLIHTVTKNPNIKIRLNTTAEPEMLRQAGFDWIIAAVGAHPIIPNIPGIKRKNVITAIDALLDTEKVGQKVAIIGGGEIGCEVGIHFGMNGRDVTILEMQDKIAPDALFSYRTALIVHLDKYTSYKTGTRCLEINDNFVTVSVEDGTQQLPFDTVILAAGTAPRNSTARSFLNCSENFAMIGDCLSPKGVYFATRTGFDCAMNIL